MIYTSNLVDIPKDNKLLESFKCISVNQYNINCGCRCIKCKSMDLKSNKFIGKDHFEDIHHTCNSCTTHFDHLDGEVYTNCEICTVK